MINFAAKTLAYTLKDDTDPKTVFALRSLNFADEQWIADQMAKVPQASPAEIRRLHQWFATNPEATTVPDDLAQASEVSARYYDLHRRAICARGVVRIDAEDVTPDQVLAKLDVLPKFERERVCAELAARIEALGQPDPKSLQPSA